MRAPWIAFVLLAAAPCRGQVEARTSSLSWVRLPGAEGCISSAELARAIEERLARRVFVSASEADLAVEGRAEREGGTWRAVLHVSEADGTRLGDRTLESGEPGCEALGRLVALTVAVMIDPLTARDPEPAPAPAPIVPEPIVPEPIVPEPIVIVRTERVEVPVPVRAEPEPARRFRVQLDSALAGTVGLVPGPALGGVATIHVEPAGFVPLQVEGALFPFSRAEQSSGHADFLHVHAGLAICPLALRERGLALHGCLGADAGAAVVVGGTLAVDERERLIGQAHVALRGLWDVIGPLALRFAVHLLVPFRHDPFTAAGAAFYAPEPVAAMIDLGAGLHFE